MATDKKSGGRSPERVAADARDRECRARRKADPKLEMDQSEIHIDASRSRELKQFLESQGIRIGTIDEVGIRVPALSVTMSASDSVNHHFLKINGVDDWDKVRELINAWMRCDDI